MIKNKTWESQEIKTEKEDGNKINHCPVCGLNGKIGTFCQTHLDLMKDYNWLKNYLNNIEKYDDKTIHTINFAISERVSYVINDVDVIDGKLAIEEFLQEKLHEKLEEGKKVKCSVWMEKILKEILALQKARHRIIEIMNYESTEV